jgi:hypothetical protein
MQLVVWLPFAFGFIAALGAGTQQYRDSSKGHLEANWTGVVIGVAMMLPGIAFTIWKILRMARTARMKK